MDYFQASATPSVTAICMIVAVYTVYRILSSVSVASHSEDEQLPPALPYALPLLGHLPQFLWNTEKLLTKATTYFGPNVPVRLQLLNRRITILNGPGNIATLFKSSRYLSSEKWLVQVLVNAFGVDAADAPFYLADDTGINNQPDPHSNNSVTPEHRIFYLVYKSVHDGLSGARLEEMQRQLVRNLSTQLTAIDVDDETWMDVPDLYSSFIRRICFTAAITSLCGSHIFEVIPNLEADFWDFDSHLPSLFREVPSWLVPAAYKARDKMKTNLGKWHDFSHAHFDVNQNDQDQSDWEEYFGSKLMRTRHAFFQRMPLSKSTISGDDLGLIWAATANAIPAIGWMLLEVLQRPALLDQVRAEIAPHITWDPSSTDPIKVDIDVLCQQTLIQSIYAEVLRLHNGTVVARVPKTSGFSIGGWGLPKDQPIMVSTYDTARNRNVWNQGTAADPHVLNDFWPERFIVDPSDASSGPVLTQNSQQDQNDKDRSLRPRFSLDGTDGSWVPYGGGSRMCPGRHFAKKELIVTMAIFLTMFDVELSPRDGRIQDDISYYMFGVMHPKGAIPARIRRRKPHHK